MSTGMAERSISIDCAIKDDDAAQMEKYQKLYQDAGIMGVELARVTIDTPNDGICVWVPCSAMNLLMTAKS